jgi:hypothetical protein
VGIFGGVGVGLGICVSSLPIFDVWQRVLNVAFGCVCGRESSDWRLSVRVGMF